MNGECNATNVQGKNYNLHKLQGGHVPQCPIAGDATGTESADPFLSRVSMQNGTLFFFLSARLSVGLSVCLSVQCRYCVKTDLVTLL